MISTIESVSTFPNASRHKQRIELRPRIYAVAVSP